MGRTTRLASLSLLSLTALFSLSALTACGHAAELSAVAEPRSAAAESPPPAPSAPLAAPTPGRGAPSTREPGVVSATAGVPAASVRAPLVTYVGEMDLRVEKDTPGAIDAVIGVAESLGGYLAARRDASVEVRVPSPRFREAMAKMEPLGEVTHRSVAATDVSDEFHDAEVRLQNLRATRARLEALLSHAGSLADTLAVEHELERVALEIDRLEGRLEYLKSRVAYSSIAVSVEARHAAPIAVTGPAPKRFVDLPIAWLGELGVDRLLTLH